MLKLAPVLVLASVLLSACGGGGGNPGTCTASKETCNQQTSGGAVTSGGTGTGDAVIPVVLVSNEDLPTITCAKILAMNGGSTNNLLFAARDAYDRGAKQLDGEPKDGIPCNG